MIWCFLGRSDCSDRALVDLQRFLRDRRDLDHVLFLACLAPVLLISVSGVL
jgi:hypothetical protein